MNKGLALYILKDAQVVGDLSFSKPIVTIGSSQSCDFCLEEESVASLQAQFVLKESRWILYKMHPSGMGIFINGQKLEEQNKEIFSGDEITLGSYRILVRITEESPKVSLPLEGTQTSEAQEKPHGPSEVTPPAEVAQTPPQAPPAVPPQAPPTPQAFQRDASSSSFTNVPSSKNQGPSSERKPPQDMFLSLQQLMEKIPASKGGVLQMLVLWKGTVIDTYHCSQKEKLYIGSKKNSGRTSGLVEKDIFFNNFPLISVSQNGVKIHFPFDMDVELFSSNKYFSFESLSQQGRVQSLQGGYSLDLLQGEIFYVCLSNGLQLLFRCVPQTVQVMLSRSLQMSFGELASLVLSFILVGCLVLYVNVKRPQVELEEEFKEAKIIRKARFVYKKVEPIPEPFPSPTPPKKKKLKKKKEPKKVRLAPKSKKNVVKLKKNLRGKKKKQEAGSIKQGGSVKVGDNQGANAGPKNKPLGGLLSAFGGGGLRKNLDKDYSGSGQILGMATHATGKVGFNKKRAGDDLGASLPQLKSLKGESSQGISSGIRTRKWKRGKVFGTGGTAKKGKVELDTSDFSSSGKGNIDRSAILRVVRRNRHELQFCYERELIRRPDLQGKVLASWQIDPQGRVLNEKVVSSSFSKGTLEKCVLLRLKSWRFPIGAVVADENGALPFIEMPFSFFNNNQDDKGS